MKLVSETSKINMQKLNVSVQLSWVLSNVAFTKQKREECNKVKLEYLHLLNISSNQFCSNRFTTKPLHIPTSFVQFVYIWIFAFLFKLPWSSYTDTEILLIWIFHIIFYFSALISKNCYLHKSIYKIYKCSLNYSYLVHVIPLINL